MTLDGQTERCQPLLPNTAAGMGGFVIHVFCYN